MTMTSLQNSWNIWSKLWPGWPNSTPGLDEQTPAGKQQNIAIPKSGKDHKLQASHSPGLFPVKYWNTLHYNIYLQEKRRSSLHLRPISAAGPQRWTTSTGPKYLHLEWLQGQDSNRNIVFWPYTMILSGTNATILNSQNPKIAWTTETIETLLTNWRFRVHLHLKSSSSCTYSKDTPKG